MSWIVEVPTSDFHLIFLLSIEVWLRGFTFPRKAVNVQKKNYLLTGQVHFNGEMRILCLHGMGTSSKVRFATHG